MGRADVIEWQNYKESRPPIQDPSPCKREFARNKWGRFLGVGLGGALLAVPANGIVSLQEN